jgi:hypothetical protein
MLTDAGTEQVLQAVFRGHRARRVVRDFANAVATLCAEKRGGKKTDVPGGVTCLSDVRFPSLAAAVRAGRRLFAFQVPSLLALIVQKYKY